MSHIGGIPTPIGAPGAIGIEDIESGIADTLPYAGVVAAPGAGVAVLADQTPGVAGIYEVIVDAGFLGVTAPVAADANNMQFQKNDVAFITLPVPASVGLNTFGPFRMTLNATDKLRVVAVGAGTAGVNYAAMIVARRVG